MLIPNAKFLVLPLVAIAVIASLPSPEPVESDANAQTRVAVVAARTITSCERTPRASHCAVTAKVATTVVLR